MSRERSGGKGEERAERELGKGRRERRGKKTGIGPEEMAERKWGKCRRETRGKGRKEGIIC